MKIFSTKIAGMDTLSDFIEKCKKENIPLVAVSFMGKLRSANNQFQELFVVKYKSEKAISA